MAEPRAVETAPPLDLRQLFDRWRWEHAVVLTYTFELPFFESYLLPRMIRGGARSVTVAACAHWLPERIRGWEQAGDVREAGRTYSLSAVGVPGTFHPKLLLAAGVDRGFVAIGSGNLSARGMATGGELFTVVEWSGEAPDLAREAWEFCRRIGTDLEVERTFRGRIEAMADVAPALATAPSERRLLHNLDRPILDQFLEALPGAPIDEVLAWAPFTDERLRALAQLAERTRPSLMTLGVQPGITQIDGQRLALLRANDEAVRWEIRALESDLTDRPSMIHAKGILVSYADQVEVALVGSPNLSSPALLQDARTGNLEAAILHDGLGLRAQLFGEGAPVRLGEPVELDGLLWQTDELAEAGEASDAPVRLLGARVTGNALTIEVAGDLVPGTEIVLDCIDRLTPARTGEEWTATLSDGALPRIAELAWPGGCTGPVIVQYPARLAAVAGRTIEQRAAPLDAIDYGADAEILALLDQLARLAVISVADVDRALRGRPAPTPEEEAAEAAGTAPPVPLEDIKFEQIRQHPRANAYDSRPGDVLDKPRVVLWLEEVIQQFRGLGRDVKLAVVDPPPPDPTLEEDDPGDTTEESRARTPWPVSRRVSLLVRNRIRRGVRGMGEPAFWQLVDVRWMAMNYILWLTLLDRLWRRAGTEQPILDAKQIPPLALDLLRAFWGDDRAGGYFSQLADDDQLAAGLLLEEYFGDSLSAATALRVLDSVAVGGPAAPFVVGAYTREARRLGLVSEAVLRDACVWLERTDASPSDLAARLDTASALFTWERFGANLGLRFGLRSCAVMSRHPTLGRFTSGDVLVAQPDANADTRLALRVLEAWVTAARQHDAGRTIFQLAWGPDLLLMYDLADQCIYARPAGSDGRLGRASVVAEGVLPSQIGDAPDAAIGRAIA